MKLEEVPGELQEVMASRGVTGSEQLDELQRGQEQNLSVEEMDRGGSGQSGSPPATQIYIPDPGERPQAIRIDELDGAADGGEPEPPSGPR